MKRPRKAFWKLVKVEEKLELRDTIGLIFGIVLPVFLLIMFGSIPAFGNKFLGTSLTAFEVYIQILMVYRCLSASLRHFRPFLAIFGHL